VLKRSQILKLSDWQILLFLSSPHKDIGGGPRPTVWALEGASQEEVARAYHEMRESRREAGE